MGSETKKAQVEIGPLGTNGGVANSLPLVHKGGTGKGDTLGDD